MFTDEEFLRRIREEAVISAVISSRLNITNCLKQENREILAHRIAEILVSCKEIYTRVMPFLSEVQDPGYEQFFDFLMELRMNFLNLLDLVVEYEEAFLNSLEEKEEDKEDEGWWRHGNIR
ncbi:MAG: hypothetical protein J7M18_01375 [Candidatus Eremiobacteraeota bacterium]|nr:hypothetical protein [Candidatus Eremiobacteraeota bacterium]